MIRSGARGRAPGRAASKEDSNEERPRGEKEPGRKAAFEGRNPDFVTHRDSRALAHPAPKKIFGNFSEVA
ncbi:hypothetical protein GCM10019017_50570 [Streptomyces showdoensis]